MSRAIEYFSKRPLEFIADAIMIPIILVIVLLILFAFALYGSLFG